MPHRPRRHQPVGVEPGYNLAEPGILFLIGELGPLLRMLEQERLGPPIRRDAGELDTLACGLAASRAVDFGHHAPRTRLERCRSTHVPGSSESNAALRS